jgi:hypothetical protein
MANKITITSGATIRIPVIQCAWLCDGNQGARILYHQFKRGIMMMKDRSRPPNDASLPSELVWHSHGNPMVDMSLRTVLGVRVDDGTSAYLDILNDDEQQTIKSAWRQIADSPGPVERSESILESLHKTYGLSLSTL